MSYVRLCKTSDAPAGVMKQFIIRGNEILVVNQNNNYHCLDARCTHAGAPLAEGELDGEVLTCPWHGSRFNITSGAVIKGPAKEALRVYNNRVEGDYLLIEI